MRPEEARSRLAVIRADLALPKMMYREQIGPDGDMYRAVAGIVSFLEDALA